MKKLITERLILREWKEDDLVTLHQICKNQHIGNMAGWKATTSTEETDEILHRYMQQDETWAVVLKEGGKLIGCIGISADVTRNTVTGAYYLAFALSEAYWGRGYTYEASKEVIRFAFEEKLASLLAVSHFSYNTQSKRVVQKCGFVYEGTRRRSFQRFDGKIMDVCMYSMTREEFLTNRKVNHTGDVQKDMTYSVVRMSRENAYTFLEWRYPAPLELYTCPPTAYEKRVSEILNKENGKDYYTVYDSFGDLIGVYEYCFTPQKQLQVEFRMKPDMMGKGYGLSFMRECLRFGMREYQYTGTLVLRIAAINLRVRQLLESLGFQEKTRERMDYNGTETEFVFMELEIKQPCT